MCFRRTVDWALDHGITTATFHIQTPYPGTRLFARTETEGRLLTRDWDLYDTRHVVYRPARLTAERLKRGAIPLAEGLALALQIAQALEAAHDCGILHGDLNPTNIRVAPDGAVKVDFGLPVLLGADDHRHAIARFFDDDAADFVQQGNLVGGAQQRAVAAAERAKRPFEALQLFVLRTGNVHDVLSQGGV